MHLEFVFPRNDTFFLGAERLPRWFGERPGKKKGDPESDDEEPPAQEDSGPLDELELLPPNIDEDEEVEEEEEEEEEWRASSEKLTTDIYAYDLLPFKPTDVKHRYYLATLISLWTFEEPY